MPIKSNHGRREAAAIVWNWQAAPAPIAPTKNPAKRAMARTAIGLSVATLLYFYVSTTMGMIVGTIASVIGALALGAPPAYAAFERALDKLAVKVGELISWILMPLFFYFVVLPFGLLFRHGSKDPMKRFFSKDAKTYWRTRSPDEQTSRLRLF